MVAARHHLDPRSDPPQPCPHPARRLGLRVIEDHGEAERRADQQDDPDGVPKALAARLVERHPVPHHQVAHAHAGDLAHRSHQTVLTWTTDARAPPGVGLRAIPGGLPPGGGQRSRSVRSVAWTYSRPVSPAGVRRPPAVTSVSRGGPDALNRSSGCRPTGYADIPVTRNIRDAPSSRSTSTRSLVSSRCSRRKIPTLRDPPAEPLMMASPSWPGRTPAAYQPATSGRCGRSSCPCGVS